MSGREALVNGGAWKFCAGRVLVSRGSRRESARDYQRRKIVAQRLRGPEMAAGFILGNAPAALVSMVGLVVVC